MKVCRRSSWLLTLLGVILLTETLQGVQGEVEIDGPSESECRPYIEKALRELEHVGGGDADVGQSNEETPSIENLNVYEKQSDDQPSQETSEVDIETQESIENDAGAESTKEEIEVTESKSSENIEAADEPVETQESTASEAVEEKDETEVNAVSNEAVSGDAHEEAVEEQEQTNEETDVHSLETESSQSAENPSIEVEEVQPAEEVSRESTEDSVEGAHVEAPSDEPSEEVPAETEESTTQSAENIESSQEALPEEKEAADDSSQVDTGDEITKESEPSVEATNEIISDDQSESIEKAEEETTRSDEVRTSSETESSTELKSDQAEDEILEIDAKQNESVEDSESITDSADDKADESIEQQNEDQTEAESTENTREKRDVNDSNEIPSGMKSQESENETQSVEEIETSPEISEEEKESGKQLGDQKSVEEESKSEENLSEAKEDNSNDGKEEKLSEENKDNEAVKSDEADSQKVEGNETEDASTSPEISESITAENSEVESEQIAEDGTSIEKGSSEDAPEEELINGMDIPVDLRSRVHVEQLLKLDKEGTKTEEIIDRVSEITLRELKRLYENAIKPLETLYKYRDLSNRHYGDAEIFSKPLILFMGPWSGGKSSIINYLLNVEYNDTALRTGAEPSPAYFNLLMYGEEEEVLDGTQLAADYTFSGLQKFGQGLEERLRGLKLKSKLLEKVNIVEIPGILEVRKQISRVFPFNDACQWFIDRADIIFLVYDPFKLDVGPETEAILDQLKGREYQTRIILNKADQVKPEELMRVQGALIWNISPLMSSPQPPVMYTTSLWSRPYEIWAPVRLLQAQERGFLRDLRSAVDKRIENKIASARRFAVRVRNHAKMVDCYLTTYYNHKSIFGNRKQVSDAIIEHPQDYHIYEGLSTLTNISRYDLPDPEVYRDFFKLNPLYEFQQLAATCTYFRGCPINKLDIAIAYDLPELVGKHRKLVESALTENSKQEQSQGS